MAKKTTKKKQSNKKKSGGKTTGKKGKASPKHQEYLDYLSSIRKVCWASAEIYNREDVSSPNVVYRGPTELRFILIDDKISVDAVHQDVTSVSFPTKEYFSFNLRKLSGVIKALKDLEFQASSWGLIKKEEMSDYIDPMEDSDLPF